jgi:hypothetical protein
VRAAGRVAEAFQVFEWMVAGHGAPAPVPATLATYEALLRGCHEAGALEKALEVLSWMHHTRLRPSAAFLDSLSDTLDIAQLWDRKAFTRRDASPTKDAAGDKGPSLLDECVETRELHAAVLPAQLRPAPHDGMRAMYVKHADERIGVRRLRRPSCSLSIARAFGGVSHWHHSMHEQKCHLVVNRRSHQVSKRLD